MSIELARIQLDKWADWLLSGGHVQSRIGYPSCSVEARAAMGGSRMGPGPVTPTWFKDEGKTHRFVMEMPEPTFLAIILQYLWTTYYTDADRKRVTQVMRENRWSEETGMDPRSYLNHVKKGEVLVANTLGG